jgi:hypothetical protein
MSFDGTERYARSRAIACYTPLVRQQHECVCALVIIVVRFHHDQWSPQIKAADQPTKLGACGRGPTVGRTPSGVMPPKKKKALADDEKEPLLDKKQSDAPSINAAADDDGEKSVRCVAMRCKCDACMRPHPLHAQPHPRSACMRAAAVCMPAFASVFVTRVPCPCFGQL